MIEKNTYQTIHIIVISIMAAFLSHCGALELLKGDDGSGPGQGNGTPGVCDASYEGTDTDGDGLSDECEAMMGTDPNDGDTDGDGIGDRFDFPGDPNNPGATQNQAWWQDFVNNLLKDTSYSSILTSSFLNESAPLGSVVQIQDQKIYLILDGQYGHAAGQSAYSFCQQNAPAGHNDFLYFYIKGDVQFCENCQTKNDIMELCGTLTSSFSTTSFQQDQNYTVQDFTWHIGRTLAGTFDPTVLIRRNNEAGTTEVILTPKQQASNGSDVTFNKVKIKFQNSFKVQGQATTDDNSSGVYIETPSSLSVERNFVRNASGTAQENPGLVGRFVNN